MTESDDMIDNAVGGDSGQPAGSGSSDRPTTAGSSGSAEATPEPSASPETPQGATGEDAPAEGEVVTEELDELAAALAERDEYKDLALRAKADFENYRKRADRRVAETRGVAVAAVVSELLPVVDNLDRAVEAAATQASDPAAFAEGVRLVHADLHAVLDRIGLTPIEAAGAQFDPNVHEAVSQAPAAAGTPAGVVVEVVQKGFKLGETVVRPARVVVSV